MEQRTLRPTVPAAEVILGKYFPCLDHGFIALKDYMGSDEAVEEAARLSYQGGTRQTSETRGLIRYLKRLRHTSPSEMVEMRFHVSMPIFVARQWVRHRTACLAGDMPVSFDLPGAETRGRRQHYSLTMRELYERWQPTENKTRPDKQKNPLHKRERVQAMQLRSVNEDTGEVYFTRIKNIWSSGVKDVYEVRFNDGSVLRATMDHRCLTESGWLSLGDALDSRVTFFSVGKRQKPMRPEPVLTDAELENEAWKPVEGYEGYEVSNLGRVRGRRNTRGNETTTPHLKILTRSGDYRVVSLSKDGVSRAFQVHKLVMQAFGSKPPEGQEIRHQDGCGANNRFANLSWGTPLENAEDRMQQGGDQTLTSVPIQVESVEYLGKEETFDMEVEGPFHNFVAGGVVVHNSLNEVSARYSLLPMLFYTPKAENFLPQAKSNKQGREEGAGFADSNLYERTVIEWNNERKRSQSLYENLAADGVARELARIDLPLSTYTQWMWKIDLHNLMHFLTLRADSHAQWEIRQYANVIVGMVKRLAPLTYQAWLDYEHMSARFSRMEMEVLQDLISVLTQENDGQAGVDTASGSPSTGNFISNEDLVKRLGSKREVQEFYAKLTRKYERPGFDISEADAKPPEWFEEKMANATPKIDTSPAGAPTG